MAYFQEHPFGQDFADRQVAQVACILANVHRKPYSDAARVEDFLPDMKREEQTPEQMKQMLRGILSGYR